MTKMILGGTYYELDTKEVIPGRETPKAIAVYTEFKGKKVFFWVPKSQVTKLDNGKLAVQAWVFNRNYARGKAVYDKQPA